MLSSCAKLARSGKVTGAFLAVNGLKYCYWQQDAVCGPGAFFCLLFDHIVFGPPAESSALSSQLPYCFRELIKPTARIFLFVASPGTPRINNPIDFLPRHLPPNSRVLRIFLNHGYNYCLPIQRRLHHRRRLRASALNSDLQRRSR